MQIIHDVQETRHQDILDPETMAPILQKALQGISAPKEALDRVLNDLKVKRDHGYILPLLEKTRREFSLQLADDLNISAALAILFDMVRDVNTLCDTGTIGISESEDVLDFLHKVNEVLAFLPLEAEVLEIPQELQEALHKREAARASKNWALADECRALIQEQGFLIEDTPQGARLKKAKT